MNDKFNDDDRDKIDAEWVAKRLTAIDAMRVPSGDLEALRRKVQRRARAPRLAAVAAAVLVVTGAVAFASLGRGAGSAQKIRTTTGATSISSTTQVADHKPYEPASNYLEDWKNNVPRAVGRTDLEGYILPREEDAKDQAVNDYVFARGYHASNALGPELTNALQVVNAIPVRDKNGKQVGWWSGHFITRSEYAGERAKAEAAIAQFEATN